MFSKKPADQAPSLPPTPDAKPRGRSMAGSNSTFSVIGSDVTIKGDVSASADLHVDGTIDVLGPEEDLDQPPPILRTLGVEGDQPVEGRRLRVRGVERKPGRDA